MLQERRHESQGSPKAAVALQEQHLCLSKVASCGSPPPPPSWASLVLLQPQPRLPFPGIRSWMGLWECIIYTSLLRGNKSMSEVFQRGFVPLCAIGNRGLNQGWGWNEQQQEMGSPEGASIAGVGAGGPWGPGFPSAPEGLGVLVPVPSSTDPPREGWLALSCFVQVLQLHDFVALIIHTAWSWV